MSKVGKKRLEACRERADKIVGILNDKRGAADVTEFISTIRFVTAVIDEYLKSKDKERPVIADEGQKLEQGLKEYEELLTSLVTSQRFVRFFTSNRVKKKLDHYNTLCFKEINPVHQGLQNNKKKGSKKATPGVEQENYLEAITDQDGRELWGLSFGQVLMVEWREFLGALRKSIPVDDDSSKHLQYILDNSNTGFVSTYRFADFLNGFGPMKGCVDKMQGIVNSEWFHGFLSSAEAERLLEKQGAGTFLIRFSKSKSGSFAIAYVDGSQRNSVTHTLITSCPPSGFKIEEAYNRNARGRLFSTLGEVVEFYSYILQVPFRSDLSRQGWFHGDLSSQEAEEILAGEKNGAFLFRFSGKAGCLAVSYVDGNQVKHGLLEMMPSGFKFDGQAAIHATLQDVVNNLKDLLKVPVTSSTLEHRKPGPNSNIHLTMRPNNLGGSTTPVAESNYQSFARTPQPAPVHTPQHQPQPLAQSGAPNPGGLGYAQMPKNPTGPGGMPNPQSPLRPAAPGHAPASPGLMYGTMPTIPSSSGGGSSSEYSGMTAVAPISQPQGKGIEQYSSITSASTAAAKQAPQAMNYGTMPTPGQLGSSGGSGGSLPSTSGSGGAIPAPAQGGQQYGTMPNPGGLGSPAPAQFGVAQRPPAPSNQYGSMPTPGGGSSGGTIPSLSGSTGPTPIHRTGSNLQYGTMPTPGLLSNSGSGGTIPTLPSATPASPTPLQRSGSNLQSNNYGTMPTPGQLGSSGGSGGSLPTLGGHQPLQPTTKVPSAPSLQYGTMPTPGQLGSSGGSGGSIPVMGGPPPLVKSASVTSMQYGTMPTPGLLGNSGGNSPLAKVASAPATSNQYGTMPTPGLLNNSGGSIPTPARPPVPSNQYGTMPTPGALGASGGIPNPALPARAAPQQYGTMPTPTMPGMPANANVPGNYGRMPPIGQPAQQPPPLTGGYGRMPPITGAISPIFTPVPTTSQYGSISAVPGGSGSLTSPSPTPHGAQQYGKMPTPGTLSFSGKISPPPGSSNSNYGSISTINSRASLTTSGNIPNNQPGGFPSLGALRPMSNYGVSAANPPIKEESHYANIPGRGNDNENDETNYGGLRGLSLQDQANASGYGGLPADELIGLQGAAPGMYDDVSGYGGLPSEDNYGGLPGNQPGFIPIGVEENNYGGLPAEENNYGGLPPDENNYGGLPAENNYGGLPPDENNYGGLPGEKESNVLRASNEGVGYGHFPSVTPTDSPQKRSNARLSVHRLSPVPHNN